MDTIRNIVKANAKAIVPFVVGGVLYVTSLVGVTGEMSVKEAVTLAVTGVVVWFVRNR